MKLRKPILLTLILIGLCAIGVSAYLQYGVPYFEQQTLEARDLQRISDLDTLNTDVQNALAASTTLPLGNPHTVYISLPSINPDCSDLNLPSLPDGWTYHCVTTPDLANTNSTGWLPINLSYEISALPIDPTSDPDTLNYYAFVTGTTTPLTSSGQVPASNNVRRNSLDYYALARSTQTTAASSKSGKQYVLSAVLDSEKYLTENVQTGNGSDPIRYTVGNDLKLWANADGLVGYWPINEGGGTMATDKISSSSVATLQNPAWSSTSCLLNHCISLSTPNQRIYINNLNISSPSLTLTVWVKLQKNTQEAYELVTASGFTFYVYISDPNLGVYGSVTDAGKQYFSGAISSTDYDTWHQIGFEYSYDDKGNLNIANIIDGQILDPNHINVGTPSFDQVDNLIINNRGLYTGEINSLEIYNYPLSGSELASYFVRENSLLNIK